MTTITISESPVTVSASADTVAVTTTESSTSVSVAEGAAVGHSHDSDYEAALGNPASDGQILSSTAAGVRSWADLPAGFDFPWQPDTAGEYDILQDENGNAMLTVDTSVDRMVFDPGPSAIYKFNLKRGTGADSYRGFEIASKAHPSTTFGFLWLADNANSPFGYDLAQFSFYAGNGSTIQSGIYLQANNSGGGKALIGSSAGKPLIFQTGGYDQMELSDGSLTLLRDKELVLGDAAGIRPDANTASWSLIQDASGNSIVTIDTISRLVKLVGCPTSDPAVAGAIWSDGGTLKISAG